jgi:phage-related protein
MTYFRGSKGGVVDLVLDSVSENKTVAIKVLFDEKIDRRELAILHSFQERSQNKIELCALGPVPDIVVVEGVKIYPYESIV